MGYIYRPKYKDKDGNTRESRVWWIKYYRNGKDYRESTKSIKRTDAKKLLKKREGEISQGKLPGIFFDRVRFDELAEDFLTDYKINDKKSLWRAEINVSHLKEHFGDMRVTDITTAKIKSYINKRKRKGRSNSTINRELSALKRMLNLGATQTPPKVDRVPHIPRFKENNVRKGFFEHEEYLSLVGVLPSELKPVITFAYKTGWRKSEILGLTWEQVDLKQGTVRIEAGEAKNDEPRTVYMDNELKALFKAQLALRQLGCPYVFHRNGTRIRDFRGAWKSACNEIGLDGKLFHDLRRTAVRNMVRAGVPERVAMMISGHKTRAVFDRYNIVDDKDLKMAAQRQEAYLESQMGKVSGKVGQNEASNRTENKAQVIEISK